MKSASTKSFVVSLLLAGFSMASLFAQSPEPPPCVPAPNGLVGWWRGEGDALDSAGANDGSLLNGASFTTAEVGKGFSFDGVASTVRIPASPALNVGLGDGLTLEAWINPANVSTFGPIIEWSSAPSGRPYGVHIWVGFPEPGALYADIADTHNSWHDLYTPADAVQTNRFQHVAVTYDKTSGIGRLYLDGVLMREANLGVFTPQTSYDVYLGQRPPGDINTGTFEGVIDEASIYNRALSTNEIWAIYNAGTQGKCFPVPPTITLQPSSQTRFPGEGAIFTVGASGTRPLSYQWRKNGEALPGRTEATLILANVQASDAAVYSVLVTNLAGAILSSNALLTVRPPAECTAIPPGLVSWWRAETNAMDFAELNPGTAMNGTAFVPGQVGQAFSFNGVDQFVSIPNSPSLNPTHITVEAWVYLPSFSTVEAMTILAKENVYGTRQYHMGVGKSAGLWHMRCGVGTSSGFRFFDGSTALQTGVWYHMAMAYDGSALKIYLNGTLDGTMAVSGPIVTSTQPLTIGGEGYGPWYFLGFVDEPTVYSRALTAAELSALYAADSAGKCALPIAPLITSQPQSQTVTRGNDTFFQVSATGLPLPSYQWRRNETNLLGKTDSVLVLRDVQPHDQGVYSVLVANAGGSVISANAVLTVVPPQCISAPAGLLSWWAAEGNALDVAGNNAGNLMNGASFLPGKVGQAFSFNGLNQFVQVPNEPLLNPTNITVEAWVYMPAYSAVEAVAVVAKENVYGTRQYHLGLGRLSGIWHMRCGVGTADGFRFFDGNTALSTNVWYHMAMTYDGSALKIYLNGALDGSMPISGAIVYSAQPLTIGGEGYGPWYFRGSVDEPSLYHRALSQADLQAIYNAGSAGKCGLTPSILQQPLSQTVHTGHPVSFRVSAAGTPPLLYQWRKDAAPIPGATASTYVIGSAELNDAANYSVSVSNQYGGLISADAHLTVLPAAGCVPPPEGIVGWWRGERNALDTIGTNDGILLIDATFGAGQVGSGFSFDGTSTAVRIPASPVLNVGLGGGLSLEAWIKPASVEGFRPVIEWSRTPSGRPYGVQIWVGFPAPGYLFANIADVNDHWHSLASSGPIIVPNQFQHVALTYDKATGIGRLLLNGSAIAQANLGVFQPQTSYDLYIGQRPSGDINTGTFDGIIDEVSVYNRALQTNEIYFIFAAGTAGKCVPNHPPVASQLTVTTRMDVPVSISIDKLLALASDPDGDILSLDSVASPSILGAPINIGTNELIYIPVPGVVGADWFTYTISDGRGGSASADILVDVRADNYISGNMLPLVTIQGGYRIGFAGIPGRTYTLQRAPAVAGPWTTIATSTVGPNGVMSFDDTNAPSGTAFYRTLYP